MILALKNKKDVSVFLLILLTVFSIYTLTASGHRTSPDEYYPYTQAERIVNQEPVKDHIPEELRLFPHNRAKGTENIDVCKDEILCSIVPIGYSISYIPFIVINESLDIIPDYEFSSDDFDDPHYVNWRNGLSNNETFSFLFFGPLFSSLTVSTIFLICRTYGYTQKTSVIASILFGFGTIAWAYSTTGFNVVESSFFSVLGFYFYRLFRKTNRSQNLLFAGMSLGFGMIVRYDSGLFILVLLIFVILEIWNKNNKIRNILSFVTPLAAFGAILEYIDFIRFEKGFFVFALNTATGGMKTSTVTIGHDIPIYEGIFGLTFSPGVGIFVFVPILILIIIGSFDFFKNDKRDVLLILSYFGLLLVFFGTWGHWHGLVAWSARYMFPIIPFFIIIIAASIERRKNIIFRTSVIVLGIIGAFFSFVRVSQDVTWFVWGHMTGDTGLFGLGKQCETFCPLWLHPDVFWTFENSQLTHSIIRFFTNLQVDIFMVKIIGVWATILIIVIITSIFIIMLKKLLVEQKR